MKKQQKKSVSKSEKKEAKKPTKSSKKSLLEFKLSIVFAGISLLATAGLIYAIQPVYDVIDNTNSSSTSQTLDRSDTLSAVFTIISFLSIALAVFFLLLGLYNNARSKPEAKS